MTWLQKLLPPRIKSTPGVTKKSMPEGLWIKCPSCETVLYRTDLEKNLFVCPKCNFHVRVQARERIEQLLDPEGRFEIGSEGVPVDNLKFKDQKKYHERLSAALEETVREKLLEGFQRAEFLIDKGAIDMIIDRRKLKDELAQLLAHLTGQPAPTG